MWGKIRKTLTSVAAMSFILAFLSIVASAQKPTIFDVADVVVGASKIETRYFLAIGKWSDSDENLGPYSVEIQAIIYLAHKDKSCHN
jgi:hypothetical protein